MFPVPPTMEQIDALPAPRRFSPGEPWLWITAVFLALGIAVFIPMAGRWAGIPEYDYLLGGLAVAGLGALYLLIVGPSRITVAVFLLFIIGSHQFRSPFILPFAGIEFHPRELLLFVLLAHFGFKLLTQKAVLQPDMAYYFLYLYAAYFALIAARGALRQPDIKVVISECRYPFFLISFFALAACIRDKKDLFFQLKACFALTVLIAGASILFFAYTFVTGHIINAQNYLGEYVPRLIGPFLLQSVRANGHMLFEVSVVVLISLMLCPGIGFWRKSLLAVVLMILLAAILLTMMRTAYVSLFVSLSALALLFMPREIQTLAWFFGLVFLGVVFTAVGLGVHEMVLQMMPENVGVSLLGRFVEIKGAWLAFLRDPLLGAGMGSTFEGMGYVAKTTQLSFTVVEYQTVHNAWIYYLFKGGLLGMTMVLAGLGGIIWRGYWVIDRLNSLPERFLMRGLLAAYIGQLVASLAMPRLTYPSGFVFVAMMAAVFSVMARSIPPASSEEAGLAPGE